jgi:hypothetical protein
MIATLAIRVMTPSRTASKTNRDALAGLRRPLRMTSVIDDHSHAQARQALARIGRM